VNKAKLSKWHWIKNVGVLVAATAGVLSAIPRVFGETNSTTTTSQIIWSIDPAPIVNLILAILPVVIVLMVVQAIFKSLTSYTRLARIKQALASPKAKALGLGLLSLLGLLVCGVTLTPVHAETSSVNFDVSGLVNIVLALMPLIIILVVMKALIGAMKDLAISTPLKAFLAILGVVALTFGLAFAPAYGQTGSLDLSQVTSGIVQIVFAILPIILVLVVVKAILDAFAKMT
jgi:hypothetical protein